MIFKQLLQTNIKDRYKNQKLLFMLKWFVFILVFIPVVLLAQNNESTPGTFKASIILGLNASQIDGDQMAGFDKLGLTGGGRVEVQFHTYWSTAIELLYSQKGSQLDILSRRGNLTRFALDYIEVPLLVNYVDGRIRLHAGMSYGYLFGFKADDEFGNDISAISSGNYKKGDLSYLIGAAYYITDNIGFDFRFTHSLLSITKGNVGSQVNKLLTLRALYQF